jgi:hypothetical protein
VRTCTRCQAQSPDEAARCAICGADLAIYSATAVALARLQASPRVSRIRLVVGVDCCPACLAAEGEFPKDAVPSLPVRGCSHPRGCRCFYEPALVDIYP